MHLLPGSYACLCKFINRHEISSTVNNIHIALLAIQPKNY
jgi:hypothetical protein